MISKKAQHPRAETTMILVKMKNLERWLPQFKGQKAACMVAMKMAVKKFRKNDLPAAKIHDQIYAHTKELFPGTAHKDPVRIFEIYQSLYKSLDIIEVRRVAA